MPNFELRRLTEADAGEGAVVLARAFHETALFTGVAPDPAERAAMARALFAANLRHACRYGEAWGGIAASGELRGVVYWVDRPEPALRDGEFAEFGYTELAARRGPIVKMLAVLEGYGLEPFVGLPLPWRYLAALGVDPDHQGLGIGTLLVARAMAGAKAAGIRCGLVADDARHVALYQRCGFRVLGEGIGPDGKTRLWTMLTDAAA